jgi:uncharacterized protein (DUF924 family)
MGPLPHLISTLSSNTWKARLLARLSRDRPVGELEAQFSPDFLWQFLGGSAMSHGDRVLAFWFGDDWQTCTPTPQQKWFTKDPTFDKAVKEWFLGTYEQAVEGRFESWMETATGALALTIVLDQFPRNIFRDTAKAFASDVQALMVANYALDRDFDQDLPPVMRVFLYLPFEHSENRDHQNRCVQVLTPFATDPVLKRYYEFALRHQAVIEQFGRFPHRNALLGRPSTPAEIEFLQQPGSRF